MDFLSILGGRRPSTIFALEQTSTTSRRRFSWEKDWLDLASIAKNISAEQNGLFDTSGPLNSSPLRASTGQTVIFSSLVRASEPADDAREPSPEPTQLILQRLEQLKQSQRQQEESQRLYRLEVSKRLDKLERCSDKHERWMGQIMQALGEMRVGTRTRIELPVETEVVSVTSIAFSHRLFRFLTL